VHFANRGLRFLDDLGPPETNRESGQPFTAFAGAKVSFLEAAILIVAPVDGLRPSPAGVSLTLNRPKRLAQALLRGKLVGDFGCRRHDVHTLSCIILAYLRQSPARLRHISA
jgi:hypothetical protein